MIQEWVGHFFALAILRFYDSYIKVKTPVTLYE